MTTEPDADLVIHGPVYRGDAVRGWSRLIALRGDRIVALGTPPRPRRSSDPARGSSTRRQARAARASRTRTSMRRSPAETGCSCSSTTCSGRTPTSPRSRRTPTRTLTEPWIIGGGWAMEYFPGGTAAQGGPRRGRARPPGVPLQPRRARRVGQQQGARDRRHRRVDAGPGRRPHRARHRRRRRPACLHEGAAYSFNDRCVPVPDHAEWRAAILDAQAHLHSLGITGWQDAWVTPATSEAYGRSAADGRLTRARGRRAVVGPAPRPRADPRPPGAARARGAAAGSPDDGEDHDRRGPREPHRRDARALLRRMRRAHRTTAACHYVDRDLLSRRVTELDAPRLPGAHARDRRPRGAQRARRGRGGARDERRARTGATTSRTCRWCSPRTSRGSASSASSRTARPTGRRASRRWTS